MPARTPVKVALLAALLLAPALAGCASGERRAERPDHPLLLRAEQAYLAGDRDGALSAYRGYRQGFSGGPFASDAWYWEGVILLEKGDAAGALAAFEQCLAGPRSRYLEAQSWIGVGDCRFVADRFDAAIEAYQRALDLRCPDARVDYCLFRLGAARQRRGEWAQGRVCYEMLIRDYPRSVLAARARQRLAYPDQSYHIQVGAFADEENAQNFKGYVLAKGMPAKVVHAGGADAPYLVWVGAWQSYADAHAAVEDVQSVCGKEATLVP